jgi:hypothetical protein
MPADIACYSPNLHDRCAPIAEQNHHLNLALPNGASYGETLG